MADKKKYIQLPITRRFVRIKALQQLYAYAIAQEAHHKTAKERVAQDFSFNTFLHDPSQKESYNQAQQVALTLFSQLLTSTKPDISFDHTIERSIAHSIRTHWAYYKQSIHYEQKLLQNGLTQSKEIIYTSYVYILRLLIEWYKLAQERPLPNTEIRNQLSQNLLLERLCKDPQWMEQINRQSLNHIQGDIGTEHIQSWYKRLFDPALSPSIGNPLNATGFLEWMVQTCIFKDREIGSFWAMLDIHWQVHKQVVYKLLDVTFKVLSSNDLTQFATFWTQLEKKWAYEINFYQLLLRLVVQNNSAYEEQISAKAKRWDRERMVLIDKLILKLALAELLECKDIPYKVSMNEYIEIAKLYSTAQSGGFINGMLEGICKGNT